MAHRLSLAFLTVAEATPVEAIRIAAATGYSLVGLRALPAAAAGEGPYALMTDRRVQDDVVRALADSGVQVADLEIVRLKPGTDVADFEPFCALGQKIGARHVLVAGDDTDPVRLADRFAAFCDLAARHGLTADLEFMPWTGVKDLATALKVVDTAARPNGGVLVDALHWDRAHVSTAEVAAIPRRLLNYVQVCDGPSPYDPSDEGMIAVARGARLLPGEGGIDLGGLVRAVPDDVTISVEIPMTELARTIGPEERARRAHAAAADLITSVGHGIAR